MFLGLSRFSTCSKNWILFWKTVPHFESSPSTSAQNLKTFQISTLKFENICRLQAPVSTSADVTFVFTSLIHTVSILSFSIFPKKSTKKDHWKSFPLPAVCSVSDNSYFIFVFPTPTRLSFLAVFVSLCSYHSQLFSENFMEQRCF